jgi:hypothetical protein
MEPGPIVRRRLVASYHTYADAQRAMDHLADNAFPVEQARIVAEGLRLVEQVTGRLSWARVLASGALAGAVVGTLIGWILGLIVTPDMGFEVAAFGALLGAAAGTIANGLTHWADGGRRDFTSVQQIDADRYAILVEDPLAEQATALLAGLARAAGAPLHTDPGRTGGAGGATEGSPLQGTASPAPRGRAGDEDEDRHGASPV